MMGGVWDGIWCIMIPMINRLGRSPFLLGRWACFYRGMDMVTAYGGGCLGRVMWRFDFLLTLHLCVWHYQRGIFGVSRVLLF
jgi:hypothetical protein